MERAVKIWTVSDKLSEKIEAFRMFPLRLFLFWLFLITSSDVFAMSRVHLTQDGGYNGIVVKIDTNVGMDGCTKIINNIKVRNG